MNRYLLFIGKDFMLIVSAAAKSDTLWLGAMPKLVVIAMLKWHYYNPSGCSAASSLTKRAFMVSW